MIPVQLNILDIFNHIKAFAVHELTKAQAILHAPYAGNDQDVVKLSAQGSHAVMGGLYNILTTTVQDALAGNFDFKSETTKLIENINAMDPFMLNKVQLVVDQASAPAPEAEPVEITPVDSEEEAA